MQEVFRKLRLASQSDVWNAIREFFTEQSRD
jgi:uncharacterized sporulation protein YeaH/YhbH (DUF444 family)